MKEDDGTAKPPAMNPPAVTGPRIERGASLRRELAMKLPVPDLARDGGGALVVDTQAIDLGADEVAGPLHDILDIPSALPANAPSPGRPTQ